jgi:hypothetical protein
MNNSSTRLNRSHHLTIESPRSLDHDALFDRAVATVGAQTKQCVSAVDGSASYTVFDKVAVFIKVEEAAGGRRQLVLTLASRDDLDSSALVG